MLKAVPEIAPSIDMPSIRRPTQADGDDDDKDSDEEETSGIKQEQENDTVATRLKAEPSKRKREAGAESEDEADADIKQEEIAHSQLDKSLITLSSLPKSRWITLADIDLIKVILVKCYIYSYLCVCVKSLIDYRKETKVPQRQWFLILPFSFQQYPILQYIR